jgi:predicted enzyme related to lactoylglutathione lyase
MTTRDTPWPDGTPCWIDLMTTDIDAARTFYGDLFGWQFEIGPAETGYYSTALLDGKRVAGVFTMDADHPPVWTTYLATGDADATADAVARAGGTLVQPIMDVMDLGRMTVIKDPTGGTFGTWQAGTHTGVEVANEPGTLVWNELMTRAYGDAKDFYASVFGYTYTNLGDGGFEYSTIELDGNTVGGLGGLPADVPAQVPPHWRVYFAVDDADEAVAKAVSIGAEVLSPAADMPYGRHADLADPQGGMFSVIKPSPGPQPT